MGRLFVCDGDTILSIALTFEIARHAFDEVHGRVHAAIAAEKAEAEAKAKAAGECTCVRVLACLLSRHLTL